MEKEEVIPFRWNISKKSEIGNLVSDIKITLEPEFIEHLIDCSAKIISFTDNSELFFVGRSLENVFDFLSGAFENTSWKNKINIIQFSTRFSSLKDINKEFPEAIDKLYPYFEKLNLSPEQIDIKDRKICFTDVVSRGGTFETLIKILNNWSNSINYDWNAVKRKIRITGVTIKKQTSPKTWRWQQQANWLNLIEKSKIKNVSAECFFWSHIANYQDKVTKSFSPDKWGNEDVKYPSRSEDNLKGLKFALMMYELWNNDEIRDKFITKLIKRPAIKESWYKNLIKELEFK